MLFSMAWDSKEAAVDMMSAFNPRRSRENIAERMDHQLRVNDQGEWVWNTDPRVVENRREEGPEVMWRKVEDVRRSGVEVLVVRGQVSDVLLPPSFKLLVENIGGQGVEVAEAGHSVVGDNLQGFLAVFYAFLRGGKL